MRAFWGSGFCSPSLFAPFSHSICPILSHLVTFSDQQAYCERLAESIKTISDLPAYCNNFDSVKAVLQKRKTVTDPFAGMRGATQARADRNRGLEHHAKIQRRLTGGATGAEKLEK